MEFPDLGQHCSERSCRRLDFLPLKCNACHELFCKDHIIYSQHKCSSAYKKVIRVDGIRNLAKLGWRVSTCNQLCKNAGVETVFKLFLVPCTGGLFFRVNPGIVSSW